MDTNSQSGQPANPTPAPNAPAQATPQAPPQPPPHPSITHAGSVGHALSNLASYIPGFAGYKAVEDRRIGDKQLRALIGERLTRVKGRLDGVVDSLSRAGSMDALPLIDQSGRRMEKIIDRMRFADYGYAAVFDRVQMGEPELDRLYQYDAGIMQELGVFDDAATEIEQASTDPNHLKTALAKLDALTAEFDRRFEARKHLFDGLPTP
ncbi:MAG TPA: hypothetical protein VGW96_03210 [Candidatus Eremiobacteraceae bacterium]|nr:hypothetical protein [Candidatus Eremiobacteraceae bacterium]